MSIPIWFVDRQTHILWISGSQNRMPQRCKDVLPVRSRPNLFPVVPQAPMVAVKGAFMIALQLVIPANGLILSLKNWRFSGCRQDVAVCKRFFATFFAAITAPGAGLWKEICVLRDRIFSVAISPFNPVARNLDGRRECLEDQNDPGACYGYVR